MPTDKLLHLLAGISIAAILYPLGIYVALGAVAVAAVGKELWDARGRGTPEVLDAVAACVGGFGLLFWYWVIL
jgi:hypothetical protein